MLWNIHTHSLKSVSATHKVGLGKRLFRHTQAYGTCTQHARSSPGSTTVARTECGILSADAEDQLLSWLPGPQMVCRLHLQYVLCSGDFKQQPWANSDDHFANTKAWQDLAPANTTCQAFVNQSTSMLQGQNVVAWSQTKQHLQIYGTVKANPKHYPVTSHSDTKLCKLIYRWESVLVSTLSGR